MLCPNCGRNVNRGDRVCGHCGTRLPYEKMSDLEAAPPLSFLKGEQRGSGTEALQNAVNSQAQRIRELASEAAFLRAQEAKSYRKTKRAFCMSIVSLVLCLLFVVISFVLVAKLSSVKKETDKLSVDVPKLSKQIEDEMNERTKIESELLDALKENLTLYEHWLSEPTPEPPPTTPEPTLEPTPKPTPGQDGKKSNGEADVDPLTEE